MNRTKSPGILRGKERDFSKIKGTPKSRTGKKVPGFLGLNVLYPDPIMMAHL